MACDEIVLVQISEVDDIPSNAVSNRTFTSLHDAKCIIRCNPVQNLAYMIVTKSLVQFANAFKTTNIFCALGEFPVTEEDRGKLRMQAHMWRQIREICLNSGVTLFADGAIRSPILLSVMDIVDMLHEETKDQLLVYTRALHTILSAAHTGGFEFLPTVNEEMTERNILQSPSDYPRRIETGKNLYFLIDGASSALFPENDRVKLEWIQSNAFLELTYALQAVQDERTPQGKRKAPPLVQVSKAGERSWGVLLSELLEVSVSDGIKRELSMQVLCACEAVAHQVNANTDPTWIMASRDISRSLLHIESPETSLSCSGSVADSLADDSENDDISLGSGDDEYSEYDSSESEWDPRAEDDDDASIGLGFGGENDEAHSDDESQFDSDSEEEAETTSSEDEKPVSRPAKRQRKQKAPTQLIESDDDSEHDDITLRNGETTPGADAALEILDTMRNIDRQSDTQQSPTFSFPALVETDPLTPFGSPRQCNDVFDSNF